MKLKPLGDRVIVKPLTQEEVTKSGIVLPDTVEKEKKEQGEVISIGSGEKIQKLGLKVGDKVLFGKYAGEDVEVEGGDDGEPSRAKALMNALGGRKVEYKVLKDEDVLAVVE